MTAIREVVRVAVTNNFNCTEQEFEQLDRFVEKNPYRFFFINSNIKTPLLITINNHPYDVVITANPDILVDPEVIERLYEIDPEKVAFVRVKYIPGNQAILDLIDQLNADGYDVVVTMQRFNGKESISRYLPDYRSHYKWSHNRFRLTPPAQKKLERFTDHNHRALICDRSGKGCQGCGICSKLTVGSVVPVKSLNLSTSGICEFNCTDCYAKTLQHFLEKCGQPLIRFDKIMANKKQNGSLKHIRDHK